MNQSAIDSAPTSFWRRAVLRTGSALVTRVRTVKANAKATTDTLAEQVFIRALCRKPTVEELAAARGLVGEKPTTEGVADLLWAVVMLPEFQLVR